MGVFGESHELARAGVGRWLLAVVVFASALALGAIHTPVLSACAALAAASAALLWYDVEPLEARPAATVLFLVGIGLTAWTVLQCVPLPHGLLNAVAHETADVWARALTPLREPGPTWAPLSLDPTGTRVQVLRGITYLSVFVAALRVARRQEGVVFLERVVVASSVAIAAAALLHPALGARKVFGLYEPGETLGFDPHHLAPLLNLNHLSAYLNIGLLVAAHAVIERRDALPRPLALVIVLLLGATIVWSLSRGGSATMVLGVLLVGAMSLAARRSRGSRMVASVAGLAAAVCGAAVLLAAAFDDTRAKFLYNDLSKIDLVKRSFELLSTFGVFGVGRGAFESTFPKVRTEPEYWLNTHPENVIAQWTTEWGLPVAVIGIVAIVWALRPRTALARSRAPAGAWSALVAVALHNLVDFSSEIPGVVIALMVCAAVVTGGAGGGTPVRGRFDGWSRQTRAVAIGLGAATAIAIAATLPFAAHELYNEERAFRDVGLDRSLTREQFHHRAREVMLRHPAEPYLPFVGAVRATVVRDESVLPWAARVLERSPVYGRVHLLLARNLYARNPSQARLEYRLGCAQDSNLCVPTEPAPLVHDFDEAMELVPDGPRGAIVLARLTELLFLRLPSTVHRLDAELSSRDHTALGPVTRAAGAALADVRNGESWCDATATNARVACVAEGLAAAQHLRSVASSLCEGHVLVAELKVAVGDVDAGFAELDAALDQVEERSVCARRLVEVAQRTGNAGRVDAAIERLLKLGCERASDCVTNLTFAAGVETSRGRSRRALTLTRKAWERAPDREDLLIEIARQAERLSFHGEALDAYTKLAERHPDDPAWSQAVTRERNAVSRDVFERR